MQHGVRLSARSISDLLARIIGPSYYDGPRFGGGDPRFRNLVGALSGPLPDPWQAVALNPQPLPPLRMPEMHALTLADAHIEGVLTLDRVGALFGGEVGERALERSLRLVAEIDELCPRWPHFPKIWPPPPPPPPWAQEEMTATELFVFGSRFLAASALAEQDQLKDALTGLGEKALELSMRG